MMTMSKSQWKQALVASSFIPVIQRNSSRWFAQFDELVFARTTPQQKLQIVKTFQADGCTVAVTGDGGMLCLYDS